MGVDRLLGGRRTRVLAPGLDAEERERRRVQRNQPSRTDPGDQRPGQGGADDHRERDLSAGKRVERQPAVRAPELRQHGVFARVAPGRHEGRARQQGHVHEGCERVERPQHRDHAEEPARSRRWTSTRARAGRCRTNRVNASAQITPGSVYAARRRARPAAVVSGDRAAGFDTRPGSRRSTSGPDRPPLGERDRDRHDDDNATFHR